MQNLAMTLGSCKVKKEDKVGAGQKIETKTPQTGILQALASQQLLITCGNYGNNVIAEGSPGISHGVLLMSHACDLHPGACNISAHAASFGACSKLVSAWC